ncbi:hypothetical protein CkaCkLH20_01137 [Colletotrichum karsti]|uniref:Altered inheritance of mitochondria protein 32 n=1 Tax=Colletotrichum karsti TaxID=1095194 RepID=A0A9P6IEM2_9PEZI|nr:uncharacterized protein CkaCkLH20_01137 [Colletotrichum karsti]KAF9880987.1 hypothetical protein CkaCkLH20_01137 [Colletotrichum karsti]
MFGYTARAIPRLAHSASVFTSRRAYAAKPSTPRPPPPPPPFETVPTCPSPTCGCAETPAMPEGLPIDFKSPLNGVVSAYAEQVLVCTGKDDWASRIEEENSGDNLAADLKELFGRGGTYSDPWHNISVLNSSFPSSVPKRSELQTTSAYLLPSFKYVPFLPRVSFDSVQALAKGYLLPEKLHKMHDGLSPIHRDRLTRKEAYQSLLYGVRDVEDVLVLVCGHGGRDMRCGVMGPVLRDEFERQFEGLGVGVSRGPVEVDEGDGERIAAPEGRGMSARVGLISHIGGHKFAGNCIVYIPPGLKTEKGEDHPLAEAFRSQPPRKLTQTTTRRLKSTATRNRNFIRPRYVPLLLLLAAAGVAWDSQWLFPSSTPTDPTEATILSNAHKFVHFDVTSKEQVSPTSFILTLKPPTTSRGGAVAPLSSLWDLFDLWCVEVKQPQIQVAREYTPLPPNPAADPNPADDALRLYVRALRGGEVSTYLSGLAPGDTVEIRGPHGEFDLSSRLGGAGGRVVFLAGGTGVASALQAARAVLPRAVDVTVFWAVRSREEVQRLEGPARKEEKKASWSWNPFARGAKEEGIRAETLSAERGHASPVARDLLALKEKYGDKLDVRVVVDQEGTRVEERDLAAALSLPADFAPAAVETAGCKFHSQTAHLGMVDGAPNAGKKFLFRREQDCGCVAKEDVAVGKNVFVVSGPEGFVQAYAGPKIWRDGGQLQGPVGGMLGALQRSNPELLKNWIVLKL